jgi:site-specific recombinase XerD
MGEDSGPAQRTLARRKACQLARHLRDELGVRGATTAKKLPYVPAEAEIRHYYQTMWTARRSGNIVLIKTMLCTGVRVAELVAIRLTECTTTASTRRIVVIFSTLINFPG